MQLIAINEGAGYATDQMGWSYILTHCSVTEDRTHIWYRHKIKLSHPQTDAIGLVDHLTGATPLQNRIISALAEVLEPLAAADRASRALSAMPEEQRCPRCGEHPIEPDDELCAVCRENLGESLLERPNFRPYSNTVCPICNQSMRPAVHCPAADACICMTHCFEGCEHLDEATSLIHCNYHHRKAKEKTA